MDNELMFSDSSESIFCSRECRLASGSRHQLHASEGCCSPLLGRWLVKLYAVRSNLLRKAIRRLVLRLEKGDLHSLSLREIFLTYHQLSVGLYSGGGAFVPGNLNPQTEVGRFCSIAYTVRSFNANHPQNTISSHAIFYNPNLGFAKKDLLTRTRLSIGNDVWMGHNAVVLSSVSHIGDGAVIGANTVVHQNVPPYATVVGNPGRVVRYRFSKEIIEELLASKWWKKPLTDLLPDMDKYQAPIEGDTIR